MRLRNNPNAMEELEASGLLITKFPMKIDKTFVLELGMGKGEMITELAFNNPKINYIGIEKYPTVAARAAKLALEKDLKNFKIICEDIIDLPTMLSGKTDLIWLTFSDPWPKNRHEKRRLTHIEYMKIYKNLISTNGLLKFKTDNDKLFEWTVEHLEENKLKLNNVTRDFHEHPSSKENIMTGYEKKWSETGKKINYLEVLF